MRASTIPTWSSTGRTIRPSPQCAQMTVVFGWRFSSWLSCTTGYGSCPGFGNGMLTSLCRITTSPASAAKSRMRSSAGFVRLAISPATFAETNSLWIVNSPMPEKTPGNVRSTRLMWSTAYMSAGLKPVIIGSKRACSSFVSERYAIAMWASVKE